ncbi:MAG TPA: GTP-binding protein [Candidatus Paceibacterota bacterium]|nr:GTP-binding protein [Verrucomicrobiota bacterium]HRY48761.1 GTP-binding protein [Candidatus Paceibacterota bacterium]
MIPLCLLTGFLGAGKTSVLEHIAREPTRRRLLFLVNELSPEDVDGHRLSASHSSVVALPGGSIFCACLVSEFIRQMRVIHRDYPDLEGVVIEASGMANPTVVHRLLLESRLTEQFSLRGIVVVVDPGAFIKLREILPNVTEQIKAANLVILNKVDLHPESLIDQTDADIREINPRCFMVRATFGEVSLDWFAPYPWPVSSTGQYAPCRDPHFVAQFVRVKDPFDLNHFESAFARVQSDFYRLKGFVPVGKRWVYLDFAGDQLRSQTVPCPSPLAGLAVILRAEIRKETHRFLEELTA